MRAGGVARARALVLWRSLVRRRRGGGRRIGAPLIGLLLAAGIAGIVWSGLDVLFERLWIEGATAREAGNALALLFAGALSGLLVFDLGDAVASLFVDSDLELLRRAPISRAQLFALKLADAMPRSALLLGVLAAPAALAFARRWDVPGWAWPLVPVQLAALWLIPVGLGAALAIEIVCRVPARRARETLALLSTLFLTLLWVANGFLIPRLAEPDGLLAGTLRDIVGQLGAARWAPPAAWTADALVAAASRDAIGVARATTLVLVSAGLAVALAAIVASRRLERALAQVDTTPRSRGGRRSRARRLRPRALLGAVVLRDARSFARDWTVLGDVLTAAALWTILPLLSAPLGAWDGTWLARAMLVALAVGLGYEVGARAIPFERQGLAWVRLAPIDPYRWVAAKLAGTVVVAVPLAGAALVAVGLAFALGGLEILDLALLGCSALLVSLSLGLWTGSRFGDPEWTNPRAMLRFEGRVIAAILLVVQVAVWLGVDSVLATSLPAPANSLRGGACLVVAGPLAVALSAFTARAVRDGS
jgi:hypothetical protein